MKLETRTFGGVTVVEPGGNITIEGGSMQLHQRVRDLVSKGRNRILFDLARVDYMDSTGVGALVASYTTAVHSGGKIALVHANERVTYLLSITNLLRVFDIFHDENTAVESLSD